MDLILLFSTIILSFSGFIIAFYGTLSKSMIDIETKNGFQKGIDNFSDQGAEYFARRYEKWNAGSFFVSQSSIILGLLTVVMALIFNLLQNPWWSSFIVLIVGYYLYLFSAKILGSKIQFISLIFLIISFCYSLYLII